MTTVAGELTMAEQALDAAESAADGAGVTIREATGNADVASASLLLDEVWRIEDGAQSILPTNLGQAMGHAGSYLAVALHEAEVVGAAVGFVGFRGGAHLHSHVLGVSSKYERSGVGFALKQHQRAWALRHGLDVVSWTFDPLVRRNAYFNLCKLGAELSEYHVNFYGEMSDGLNAGDETDRAVVTWDLSSPKAVAASKRELQEPDVDALIAKGAVVVLDETAAGEPEGHASRGDVLLCRIPEDIVEMRRSAVARALSWRKALRTALTGVMEEGFVATGISKSGWYVLERPVGRT